MLLARAAPTVGGYYGYEHLDALPLPESSRIFSRFSRTSLVCFVWAQMFSLIVSSMAKWIQNGRKSAGHHGTAIWHQSQPVTVVSATE